MARATALNSKQEISMVRDLLKQNHGVMSARVFELGILFGLRISDLLSLTWEQLDSVFNDGEFQIIESKTRFKKGKDGSRIERNDPRTIYVNQRGLALLARMRDDNPDHVYVFQSPRRSRITKEVKPLDRTSIYKQLKSCEEAVQQKRRIKGIRGKVSLSCHTLRKQFATVLRWSGVELSVISKLIGHRNINTTMIYLGIESEELFSASNSLEAFLYA